MAEEKTKSKRVYKYPITYQSRQVIEQMLDEGKDMAAIARALNVAYMAVYREVMRNGGTRKYKAFDAQMRLT